MSQIIRATRLVERELEALAVEVDPNVFEQTPAQLFDRARPGIAYLLLAAAFVVAAQLACSLRARYRLENVVGCDRIALDRRSLRNIKKPT